MDPRIAGALFGIAVIGMIIMAWGRRQVPVVAVQNKFECLSYLQEANKRMQWHITFQSFLTEEEVDVLRNTISQCSRGIRFGAAEWAPWIEKDGSATVKLLVLHRQESPIYVESLVLLSQAPLMSEYGMTTNIPVSPATGREFAFWIGRMDAVLRGRQSSLMEGVEFQHQADRYSLVRITYN